MPTTLTLTLRTSTRLLVTMLVLAACATAIRPSAASAQSPATGPGGPILVVTDPSDPIGTYYAEILRAEGLNEFTVADKSALSPAALAGYDVVLLAKTALDDAQAAALSTWVQGGGNLVAMRPDARLAGLVGLGPPSGTLSDGYLKVDTSSAPGAGITGDTMQFHGAADRYALADARAVASLYSSPSIATPNPAVTLRTVGSGDAAAFTYDLARSVVQTRQGNPAWAGQERDGEAPRRSDDLFFGGAQPDWVNLDKVAIPQADEQQRLLANLIEQMTLDRKPLPRFWYLPSGKNAAVVMSGDDHGTNGTEGRFDSFAAASPVGCSVQDWQCVRGTSYVYPSTPLTNVKAAQYQAAGFEIALHLHVSGSGDCSNFTGAAGLDADLSGQLDDFKAAWPSLSTPITTRTHCIVWSDWSTEAKVEAARGFRLDANYYYWPAAWVQDRPGFFTGSGLPMRFADENGALIDIYQAATQLTDESGQNVASEIKALLDNALGTPGYYAVITANIHTDNTADPTPAQAILAEATSRGVPIVSARQMATWLDGRNSSAFQSIGFANGNTLTFTVSQAAGARNLQAMVPTHSAEGVLLSLTRGGSAVPTTVRTIKGIEYAFFDAASGSYIATYSGGGSHGGTGGSGGGTGSRTGAAGNGSSSGTSGSSNRVLPRITIATRTVRATRNGIVTLRISCPRAERHCQVDLRLRRSGRTLAHGLVVIGGGKTAKVRVRLNRSARAQLRRARSLLVQAVASATDDAKHHATTTTQIRLLAPKRR